MLKQGFGRIINIASTSGLYGTPKLATYCMAKWGVLGLTKTLAKEVGSKGIIVNALCPTKVKTPMCETQSYVEFINELTGKNFKDYKEMYAGVPFLDVEDFSDMVYWLGTSRAAGKFNGRDVALDLFTIIHGGGPYRQHHHFIQHTNTWFTKRCTSTEGFPYPGQRLCR